MSDVETLDVEFPGDEEFLEELLAASDAETVDDFLTRLLDKSIADAEAALELDGEPREVEIPADTADRCRELFEEYPPDGEEFTLDAFIGYTLKSVYLQSRGRGSPL